MNLNVFKWAWRPRYYLTKPWKWVKELFRNIRAAWMRAIKGYCYMDVWDWDSWFCSVIPPMLRDMANKGMAYPGSEPFDTPEKWHNWLYEMAHKIERLRYDDWMEDKNEYSKEYHESFENDWHSERQEEIRKKYYERCVEIHKTRQQVLEEFGSSFFKFFDCLWD